MTKHINIDETQKGDNLKLIEKLQERADEIRKEVKK